MERGWVIGIVTAFIIVVCGCAVISGIFGYRWFLEATSDLNGENLINPIPTSTPVVVRPNPGISANQSETDVNIGISSETLEALKLVEIPPNNLRELAKRLEGKNDIPLTVPPPSSTYEVGTKQSFWVSNVDSNENFQIETTLKYETEHVYFWVQDGVSINADELQQLVETFENHIYPLNRNFFGSEWTPGVDGDPHLYIIYASGLGSNLAGYYSSADELHPLAHEFSNAHEAFVLSADNVDLGSNFAYGVLAHEFQHMIHWFRDRNEASWVNEGFSELAVLLNGYWLGSVYSYILNPDIQLNDWPYNNGESSPHYEASFLFFTYYFNF